VVRHRRGSRPGEETPFVDLAFSLLGPITAVMIILAAAYAAEVSREPACRVPSQQEMAAASTALAGWFADAQNRIGQGRRFIHQVCPTNSQSVPKMTPPGISPLHGICTKEADAIIASAGLTAERMARVLSDQASLDAAFAQCSVSVPPPDCNTLSEQSSADLAQQMKTWWDAAHQRIADIRSYLDTTCHGWSDRAEPTQAIPGEPSPLVGLCRSAASRVLRQAGLDETALQAFSHEQSLVGNGLLSCSKREEIITVPEDQLGFEQCKADINRGADFFVETAEKIHAKILSGDYNRVDIFGHSDATTFKSCTVKVHWNGYSDSDFVIHDNVMLSLLRADAFLNNLLAAIRAHPELADLADLERRIADRSLRLYTIGVGDAEPKATAEASRRIELRFVSDQQGH
jgi:hypothetical protein